MISILIEYIFKQIEDATACGGAAPTTQAPTEAPAPTTQGPTTSPGACGKLYVLELSRTTYIIIEKLIFLS